MLQSHPPPHVLLPQFTKAPSNRKSMEEVWKDINLPSICNYSTDAPSSTNNNNNTRSASGFRNIILHEFLAGPFNKDSSTIVSSVCNPISGADSTFLEQPQSTLLALSSRSVFQKQSHDSFLSSFDTLKSSTICPSHGKKRVQQDISASSDPRYQRVMKNRESAARSRARKQAYKNGLESKLARLTEENSSLRRQVEQQLCLTSSAKPPKMRTLNRTSSSPF